MRVVLPVPDTLYLGIVWSIWAVSRIPVGPIVIPVRDGMVVTVLWAAGVTPDTPDTQHMRVVSELRVLPVVPATSL